MKKRAENEEISIDVDTGEEIELEEDEVINSTLKDKLKRIRDELKTTQKERDDNLAGWQRAKADLVNFRKNVEEDRARNESRVKGAIIKNMLPALDTFETAMQDKSWNDVDVVWKEGVTRIRNQLHQTLKAEGLENFGEVGEVFDPTKHECVSVTSTDEKDKDHTIAQVLQQGYSINGELVRPAKVIVAQLQDQ